MKKALVLLFIIALSGCMIDRHRSFRITTGDDLYVIMYDNDFSNQKLAPYTADDTIFALLMDMGYYTVRGKDIRDNIVCGAYNLRICTKKKGNITFRIKKLELEAEWGKSDINNLIVIPSEYPQETSVYYKVVEPVHRIYAIVGGYFHFKMPKDKMFNVNLSIEVEEDGVTNLYDFRYHYTIKKKDHWITLKD